MDFESQVRELRRQKNNAEEEFDSATERWRIERRKLKAEIDQLEEKLGNGRAAGSEGDWQAERERLTSEISRLEITLAQNIARSDQVHREYELKIEDLTHQNERLRQELQSGAIVAATEVRLISENDDNPINAEMRRVGEAIHAIEALLEHPDTTASEMARKNTERAENEAYLRGLAFQGARIKGA